MDIITFIIVLALVGLLLWLVVTYVPMPQPYRTAVIVLVVILIIVWALRVLGVAVPRI